MTCPRYGVARPCDCFRHYFRRRRGAARVSRCCWAAGGAEDGVCGCAVGGVYCRLFRFSLSGGVIEPGTSRRAALCASVCRRRGGRNGRRLSGRLCWRPYGCVGGGVCADVECSGAPVYCFSWQCVAPSSALSLTAMAVRTPAAAVNRPQTPSHTLLRRLSAPAERAAPSSCVYATCWRPFR